MAGAYPTCRFRTACRFTTCRTRNAPGASSSLFTKRPWRNSASPADFGLIPPIEPDTLDEWAPRIAAWKDFLDVKILVDAEYVSRRSHRQRCALRELHVCGTTPRAAAGLHLRHRDKLDSGG